MLSHGLATSLPLWPAAIWPLIFSSCLYAIVRMCGAAGSGSYGTAPLDARRAPDAMVLYLFFPLSAVIEVATHSYMLMTVGYLYLVVVIPVYVMGWILLPALLEAFRPAQYLLPLTYLLFAGAFGVLIGLIDNGPLRVLNAQLHMVLTGLPTPM